MSLEFVISRSECINHAIMSYDVINCLSYWTRLKCAAAINHIIQQIINNIKQVYKL